MKLIVISYPKRIENEIELLIQLFDKGLEFFHLRKPDYSLEDLVSYIEKIPVQYHSRVILHSHFELLERYNLKGVHFSRKTKHLIDQFENYTGHKSISCHSFEEVDKLNGEFNYAFLSPIYNSISKSNYNATFEKSDIVKFFNSRNSDVEVVALGGIDESNTYEAINFGFKGVAVLGIIWKNFKKDLDISLAINKFNLIRSQLVAERVNVLSIAGFDPSAGAGVLSDIKTFEENSVYGFGVNTATTFQNADQFEDVNWISVDDINRQIDVLSKKHKFSFVKIGLVKSFDDLELIIDNLYRINPDVKIVWDPILKASAGFNFHSEINKSKVDNLLKKIFLLTPNLDEAKEIFSDIDLDITNDKMFKQFQDLGLCNILLKGGHSEGNIVNDILFHESGFEVYEGVRFPGFSKHGTGCVLSSVIISNLAKNETLKNSCKLAKEYMHEFILSNNNKLGYHKL